MMSYTEESLLFLNKKLNTLSYALLQELLLYLDSMGSSEKVLVSFFHKYVDVLRGIILLQDNKLMEDAQILIRVLFEVNLNIGDFVSLVNKLGDSEALSIIQKQSYKMAKKNPFQKMAISEKYHELDYYEEKLKKYDPFEKTLEERAKSQNIIDWYNGMYRNFSRNVHARDWVEYLLKNDIDDQEVNDYFVSRNLVGMEHSFLASIQIMKFFNQHFNLGADAVISDLESEYKNML